MDPRGRDVEPQECKRRSGDRGGKCRERDLTFAKRNTSVDHKYNREDTAREPIKPVNSAARIDGERDKRKQGNDEDAEFKRHRKWYVDCCDAELNVEPPAADKTDNAHDG